MEGPGPKNKGDVWSRGLGFVEETWEWKEERHMDGLNEVDGRMID